MSGINFFTLNWFYCKFFYIKFDHVSKILLSIFLLFVMAKVTKIIFFEIVSKSYFGIFSENVFEWHPLQVTTNNKVQHVR